MDSIKKKDILTFKLANEYLKDLTKDEIKDLSKYYKPDKVFDRPNNINKIFFMKIMLNFGCTLLIPFQII